MKTYSEIVAYVEHAADNGFLCGTTKDGRQVFHALSWQKTVLQYWFTLDADAVGAPAGDPRQFDIRECPDRQIVEAVAHWSGYLGVRH